jgi:CubicO group peptidase (beta-lactamase class C family)
MEQKTNRRVVLLLLILAGILAACRAEPTSSVEFDQPDATQLPVPAESGEIIAGELGQTLDDFFSEDNPLFSGSVLVAQDGEILLSKGYNYANWEHKTPNSALTKYRISSITKPFTATMVMMLAERGLLNLDERICTYLPNCPVHWQEITIQNLLNHTSGVPEYTTLLGAREQSRDPHTVSALIDIFRDEALLFLPGETFQYSNSNFILLGAIIEQVTGERYDQFLRKAILNPLEIEDTGMDYASEILEDRAAGYQIQGRALVNAPYLDMSNAYATAGMYSTIGDLFAFDQALYSDQLLSQENQEIMYSPHPATDGSGEDYGLGWQLAERDGHRRVGHNGGINGFRVFWGRYLDDQVTIILLSNIETEDIDKLVDNLEQIVFPQD